MEVCTLSTMVRKKTRFSSGSIYWSGGRQMSLTIKGLNAPSVNMKSWMTLKCFDSDDSI